MSNTALPIALTFDSKYTSVLYLIIVKYSELSVIEITNFMPYPENTLPKTYRLLVYSRLVFHPSVCKITLYSSCCPTDFRR